MEANIRQRESNKRDPILNKGHVEGCRRHIEPFGVRLAEFSTFWTLAPDNQRSKAMFPHSLDSIDVQYF